MGRSPAKTPRYMAPTISKIHNLAEQKENEVVKIEDQLRGGRSTSFNTTVNQSMMFRNKSAMNVSIAGQSTINQTKVAWKPTGMRD